MSDRRVFCSCAVTGGMSVPGQSAAIPVTPEEIIDSAVAARAVAQARDVTFAALAGEAAAQQYGLDVLLRDLQDRADNVTRFVGLERRR